MAKVFVCYARKDIKQVKSIVNEINGLGFDYWMDTRNLQSGEIWTEEIARAILACEKFLLLISKAAMVSDNVRREVQLAYENEKKFVLLRLEDVDISPHMKYQLAGIQWIDRWARDWNTRLAVALGRRIEKSSIQRSGEATKDNRNGFDEKTRDQEVTSQHFNTDHGSRIGLSKAVEQLSGILNRYESSNLDYFSYSGIDSTISSLESFFTVHANDDGLNTLLGLVSSVITDLYVARGYATPDVPRHREYYQSMNSVRRTINQIKRIR